MKTGNSSLKRNNKSWMIILSSIIAIAVTALINKDYLQLKYESIKYNPFNVGDSIYASKTAYDISPTAGIPLLRLANDNGSNQMVGCDVYLDDKLVLKNKVNYIGKYLGQEIRHVEYLNTNHLDNFYIIDVNPDIIKKASTHISRHTYVNNNYYIEKIWVSKK